MPNKTIYVSDDDLPLFERAQEIAGSNLSSAIVRALRRFIEIEEARKGGLAEITVIVGPPGGHQRKRFIGARLARWLQKSAAGKGTDVLGVYRTAKGHFALHTRTIPDWKFSWGDPGFMDTLKSQGDTTKRSGGKGVLQNTLSKYLGIDWDDIKSWDWGGDVYKESSSYSLAVFETLEELEAHVPQGLYKAVAQALEWPEVEELDI